MKDQISGVQNAGMTVPQLCRLLKKSASETTLACVVWRFYCPSVALYTADLSVFQLILTDLMFCLLLFQSHNFSRPSPFRLLSIFVTQAKAT